MRTLPATAWPLLLRCGLQRAQAGGSLPAPGQWQAGPLAAARRRRFNAELGFAPEAWPLAYHYLALQRAQLDWMLQPGFPHRLLGMVHLAQSLQRLGPWQAEAGYTLRLQGELEGLQGRQRLRLHAVFEQQGRTVLRAESLYLPPRDGERKPRKTAAEPEPEAPPRARWALPAGAGRRYAWLSGDANPIHLGRLGARLFGLRAPLIHGAHTLARCEAVLRPGGDAQSIAMRFLKPLSLPGEARLRAESQGYAVWGTAGRCAEFTLS